MEKAQIIDALDALAQESRLDLFRLLVKAGPQGMTPTALSKQLRIAPPTLSFHLGRLAHAGLVTSRRRGRSIAYTPAPGTIDELIGYLNANVRTAPAAAEKAPEKPAGERAGDKPAKDAAPEAKKAETPAEPDAGRPEPAKAEPGKPESAKPDPNRTEPNRKAAEPTA